jgi:hypothetical protein
MPNVCKTPGLELCTNTEALLNESKDCFALKWPLLMRSGSPLIALISRGGGKVHACRSLLLPPPHGQPRQASDAIHRVHAIAVTLRDAFARDSQTRFTVSDSKISNTAFNVVRTSPTSIRSILQDVSISTKPNAVTPGKFISAPPTIMSFYL